MLPPPFALSLEKRRNRSLTQDVTPFLHNIIFQYTNPLPFEREPHTIHTIPLAREHCDSYLYYIRYKTLEITPSQRPFQVIFNPGKELTLEPIIEKSIHKTLHSLFMMFSLLICKNSLNSMKIKMHHFFPSHLEDLKHKSEYFDVPDLETKIQKHDNPHHWLQQDILQVKNFQYRFFNNITLTEDTIPQVKVFTQFLLKFLRFNYQLLWEQQDQQAYIHFPQRLTPTELLPYVIKNEHKHLQYRYPTSFNTTHFEQINLDHNFISEHFETSDNRPYLTTNTSPETISEEQLSNVLPQVTRQNTVQLEKDNLVNFFHTQTPQPPNPLSPQIPRVSDLKHINPSDTATIHNTSELFDETEQPEEQTEQTVQNTQSLTITNDSNPLQIPFHHVTTDETTNQTQDITSNTTQDNTSDLSTSHTNITQPSQTHRPPHQNYDPPSLHLNS